MRSEFGVAPGELLAVDLPPGPTWVPLLHRLWAEGVTFLPLDDRLSEAGRRRLLDVARPTALLGSRGLGTVYADGASVDPEVAVVIATSGTAGEPRLVELSRAALLEAVEGSRRALAAAGHEVDLPLVACLPPAHVGGLLVLMRAEITDLPITVHERFDAERLALRTPTPSEVSLVPAMVHRLVRLGADLRGFPTMLVGGGALDPGDRADAERLGARIVETYGLSETSGGVVYDGRPFTGTRMRIGDGGRIELLGPTVMRGYRGDASATGAAFDVRGWLRTSDAGSIGDDGRLRVLGRLDDAIRTGAMTVWPDEVERSLASHPKIAEVGVAGRPHPEWGQHVVAFVVPRMLDDPPTLEELRAHALDRLERHQAPRDLVLLTRLPRTPGGKLRRAALPER